MKKLVALLLAVLLMMSLLTGCGGSNKSEAAMDAPAADAPAMGVDEEIYVESESGLSSSDGTSNPLPENQKIITTLYMEAETEDMDPLLADINQKIQELGGYMEAQDIYNGSSYNNYRYRYSNMTIRIPAEKLDSFVNHVSENANIISKNTTTENVTLTYIATESRMKALETEQTRLLELLAMAENMEDLLLIESRLTEVRAELERVASTLRNYDNLINYSTIHLNVQEVKEYTDVEEPETVWQRISKGFVRSLENVGEGLVDFFVGFVVAIPYLLIIAVIAAVIVVIIVASSRKKKKKNDQQPPAQQ